MKLKARFLTLLAAAGLVLALSGASLAAEPIFSKPALITAIGQSSDAAIVKVMLNNKLKMGMDYKLMAQPADLAGVKTVIMVVGASAKGLGAAGIDLDQEAARTKALLKEAKEKGVKVLFMHTGGESRRGKSSNDLIELVLPSADAAVVVAAGNKDKFISNLAAKRGIPYVEVAKTADAGEAAKGLFKE
ncbi:MAG: DUF6305 family protein [Chitinophagales bacterium]